MNWFRSVYHWYLSLNIVRYPVLGRLGVWLCNRYTSRRYRTRVEDNLVIHGFVPYSAGPFSPEGGFNIEYFPYTLPPKRSGKPWWGSDLSFRRLLEMTRLKEHVVLRYAIKVPSLSSSSYSYLRGSHNELIGFATYREAEAFVQAMDDFKPIERIRFLIVDYPPASDEIRYGIEI